MRDILIIGGLVIAALALTVIVDTYVHGQPRSPIPDVFRKAFADE